MNYHPIESDRAEAPASEMVAQRNHWIRAVGLEADPLEVQQKISNQLIGKLLNWENASHEAERETGDEIQQMLNQFRKDLQLDCLAVVIAVQDVPEEIDLLSLSFHPEKLTQRDEYFSSIHREIDQILVNFERSSMFAREKSFGISVVNVAPGELALLGALARLPGVRALS